MSETEKAQLLRNRETFLVRPENYVPYEQRKKAALE